jgi:hypothetical protein
VGDIAGLITAIGSALAAVLSGITGLIIAVRSSGRERPQAARNVVEELAEAAEDGLTKDEIRKILRGDQDER